MRADVKKQREGLVDVTLRKYHHEQIRKKIQTSLLIHRLTECAKGKLDLTFQQLKAIEILLKKSLPDLTSIEHKGDVQVNFIARAPTPEKTAQDWLKAYAPPLAQLPDPNVQDAEVISETSKEEVES